MNRPRTDTTLIVSLNPALDTEWRVDGVLCEEKNRILAERRWAGGKGVNVARWYQHFGGRPRLLVPLGGATGKALAGCLEAEQMPLRILPIAQPNRVDIIITTTSGRQLRFNPAGPVLSATEWQAVYSAVQSELRRSRLLVLSGSLPSQAPVGVYAELIRLAARCQAKALVDCDGPALAAAVRAKPFLLKPNAHELGQWWGRPLRSTDHLRKAARALAAATQGWVLVSHGRQPAWLVNPGAGIELTATPPRVKVVNTVGAGDALLAAAARQIEQGAPPEEWLRWGLAAGAAAVQCRGGLLPSRSLLGRMARLVHLEQGCR